MVVQITVLIFVELVLENFKILIVCTLYTWDNYYLLMRSIIHF